MMPPLLTAETLARLRDGAAAADTGPDWPRESLCLLQAVGVPSWVVPADLGGSDLPTGELLDGYEALAGACLTTTFIHSQRDAAARRLRDLGHGPFWEGQLAALARGEAFWTVGLSQLTTSRQHTAPALTAEAHADGSLTFTGLVPWVTGADQADAILIGATCADGRQVLAGVPRGSAGMRIDPPLNLMALAGSRTAVVHLDRVRLAPEWRLAGPAEKVLSAGSSGGPGGLETSCLALGLAGAAVDFLHAESLARADLRAVAERFESERQRLRADLHRQAAPGAPADGALMLRVRANQLVLQATQAALTAAKGAGFMRPHPAQRWARQALFFLVWSCPRPAAAALLEALAPADLLPGERGASAP